MKSGCQTQKLEREEDSSPPNGNSKHRCENNGSSTSGREGMSNTENTHSGKYCVIFLFKNITGINNFNTYRTEVINRNIRRRRECAT